VQRSGAKSEGGILAEVLHMLWNRRPWVGTVKPDRNGGFDAARIIQAADRQDKDLAIPREERRSALGTKLALDSVATVRLDCITLGLAFGDRNCFCRHDRVIAKVIFRKDDTRI
jgi:hypothetical protein